MVWYATREDVKSALDSAETARNNAQVDRAIEAASRSIDKQLGRPVGAFAPTTGTRYFDWPDRQSPTSWRLWLDQHTLISLTSLTAGGTVIPTSALNLEPVNSGPPYTHIEVKLSSSSAFSAGSTYQQAIVAVGVWGFGADEDPAGSLATAVTTTSATTCNVTDSSILGVGAILRVDSERMLVTGRSLLSTGQTLQTPLTASLANDQGAVSDGTQFHIDEVLTLDTERMKVVDIAGNNLTVRRAWDGSVLAAHTGSTIYAPRTLTVTRGALGTTAATHLVSAPVAKHAVPGLIRNLCIAESLLTLGHETTGYARTAARGEAVGKPILAQIEDLRDQAYTAYGRNVRARAV